MMRDLRKKFNKEIAHLSPEQWVEYFRKHHQTFESEMGKR
jgi:hypothetical protein